MIGLAAGMNEAPGLLKLWHVLQQLSQQIIDLVTQPAHKSQSAAVSVDSSGGDARQRRSLPAYEGATRSRRREPLWRRCAPAVVPLPRGEAMPGSVRRWCMGVRRRRSGGIGRSPPGRRPCPGALGQYRSPTHEFIPCIVTPQRALLAFWGVVCSCSSWSTLYYIQAFVPFGLRALRPAREPTSRRRVRQGSCFNVGTVLEHVF